MNIDLIYLAWNRRKFTEFSFQKLLENTDWDLVNKFIVYDDGSTDGTSHWLSEQVVAWNTDGRMPPAEMHHTDLKSPVATMLHYLDHYNEDAFAKIDSDIVVCPGWLKEMNRVMYKNPALKVLGMQPNHGPPRAVPDPERSIEVARWIGGVGLIRTSAFNCCRPVARARFGWTEWQQSHREVTKAWIRPDMPIFELDRVPVEPWLTLAAEYVDKGWSRAWGTYASDHPEYWDWAFES